MISLQTDIRVAALDSPQTIFCELFWQLSWSQAARNPDHEFLNAYQPYDEFLELPISVYFKHPLRLAIGHRDHSRQMRTGWSLMEPTQLSERNDRLNNVLVETSASNWLKYNWPTSCYPDLKRLVSSIQIPSDLFHRDGDADLPVPRRESDLEARESPQGGTPAKLDEFREVSLPNA